MRRGVFTIIILLFATLFFACRQRGDRVRGERHDDLSAQEYFAPVQPPTLLNAEQQRAYIAEHYWDNFDFSDTTLLSKIAPQQLLEAYVGYIAGCVTDLQAEQLMSRLMQRASSSKAMFDCFVAMAEAVLHDPNSQYRSDEKYIPVLKAAISSPYYNHEERMPYIHDLAMAEQNRVGARANDFSYTLLSGSSAMMSAIEAKYLLIFISNPGCAMCRDVREQILRSAMLSEMIDEGELKILVLYPDEDLKAWREYIKEYPPSWINGYDKDMVITSKQLYDLRAIPSLYLLDRDKRVMVKDSSDVREIEHFISMAETN